MNKKIERIKLTQFGNLELLAKQVVEGFITGLHKSPFHGFSVEFAEHRIYNAGESTRHIDWKLFGRTEKLFTKKYEEETNLRCQIVIDCSGSMYFPKDAELTKFDFSVYAGASLIELLKRQRDAVGLTFFADKIEIHTAAKSSMAHHRYLYSELEKRMLTYTEDLKKDTNAIKALDDVAELCHTRSLIIIFSDLLDDPDKTDELFRAIQHMKHNKHEVVLFHVVDQKTEVDFDLENRPYELIDMETGEHMRLQPGEIKELYKSSMNAYFEELKIRCMNYGIDFMPVDIAAGYDQVLQQYMIKRQKLY
jgi:uncharacterized protein (DUF58 family)